MYLVSAFIKLSAVLQYRGGDEAAISIMDTQRHSIAVTQNSHLLEDIFEAPLLSWGHLLMLMIQSYRDVGVGCVTSAANRLIGEVVQSRRRPLLGPSPS